MKRLAGLMVGALLFAACGGASDDSGRRPTPRPSTTNASATNPATTATTSPATRSTAATCEPIGGTIDVRVDYPNRMSSLVGKDVRTGAHPCTERFVVELRATNLPQPQFPGYWVRYGTGPVALSPSGQPVTIRGGAVMLVSLGSWMVGTGGAGYSGPRDALPTNVSVIQEYRLIEDFEGQSTWAVGIDIKRNFKVSVLSEPPRLVIDIQTSP